MNETELTKYRALLRAKQIELAPQVQRRDGIAIEATPDAFDEVGLAAERELMTRNLERGSKLLREVGRALERIDEGSYGTCTICEQEISAKRLSAVPWTSFCIECQELDEHRRAQVGDLERLRIAA